MDGLAKRMGRAWVLSVAVALALPIAADAATFHVTSNGVTGSGTLKSAISHANTNGNPGEVDSIKFDLPLRDENPIAGGKNVITLFDVLLPSIVQPVRIKGCSSKHAPSAPCVVLRKFVGGGTGFEVNASKVKISGFKLLNWGVAVDGLSGQSGLVLKNNWFGTTGSGAADADNIAVQQAGDAATIGGTKGDGGGLLGATRNVFAGCSTYCLLIRGGDDNRILGNYFALNPTGGTAGLLVPSEDLIEITGFPSDEASGNSIGDTVSDSALATPACDGACNAIPAMANGYAVDLSGGGSDVPAVDTRIAGNHFGLTVDGTDTLGAGSAELHVGDADGTMIGGVRTRDRNVFGGEQPKAITASALANGLEIRRNFIGLNAAGTTALAPSDTEVEADHLVFDGNRVGGTESPPFTGGLVVQGSSTITSNVFGVGTGGQDVGQRRPLVVKGNGNTIDRNVFGFSKNSAFAAVDLDSADGNLITGNLIGTDANGASLSNAGDGIRLRNGSSNNQIGGSTPESENVMSNNVGFAIHLTEDGTDENLIARNRGDANGGGKFAELEPDGPTGPNAGAPAPAVTAVSTAQASGTAPANSTIRVYRTTTTSTARLDGFVGSTVADVDGNWTLTFPTALATGVRVAASETLQGTQNTSELSPTSPVP